MRSIRSRIAVALLASLAVLWAAGGSAVFLTSRSAALARIDAENQELARQVRSLVRGPGGGRRGPAAESSSTQLVADGVHYQAWSLDGEPLLRSESLGKRDLPRAEADPPGEPVFGITELGDGTRLRYVSSSFGAGHGGGGGGGGGGGPPPWAGGGMRDPVIITVGHDLAPTRAEQRKLLGALVAIGLAAGAATCGVVALSLRSGLRPLRELDESIARVDATSLGVRFGRDDLPTELEPVVERLDELMERLEAGFQRERDFSAALAHEMRTPVAELRAMAELAIDWPEERTEGQMRSMLEVSERMHRMVDALLELARVEGNAAGPPQEDVDLKPILDGLWQSQQTLARERGLEASVGWPEGESLPGRPEWWRHLLGNLLANAVEYARPGGRIELRPTRGGLEIRNSVEGLDESDVRRLFDRFWRADRARTGERHAGLGLSLARACAEAMGYRLEARLDHGNADDSMLVMEIRPAA